MPVRETQQPDSFWHPFVLFCICCASKTFFFLGVDHGCSRAVYHQLNFRKYSSRNMPPTRKNGAMFLISGFYHGDFQNIITALDS